MCKVGEEIKGFEEGEQESRELGPNKKPLAYQNIGNQEACLKLYKRIYGR
jgi:hypothetical protein